MLLPVLVLVISSSVFVALLLAVSKKILAREFDQPYFQTIARAEHLEFARLPAQPYAIGTPEEYYWLRIAFKCDFHYLDYLMKEAIDAPPRHLVEERFLAAYFRALMVFWILCHHVNLRETRVIAALADVLRYNANVVGEQTESRAVAVRQ